MATSIKAGEKVEAAHTDCIWALTWAKDGQLLTGGLDGTVKLWSPTLVNVATSAKQKYGVNSVVASKDGSYAVACFQDAMIRIYKLPDTNEPSDVLKNDKEDVIDAGMLEAWTVTLSTQEDVIASGTHKGAVNLWSMRHTEGSKKYDKVGTMETGCKMILSTAFNKDDSKLATAGIDGYVNVFDITTQTVVHKLEAHALPVRSVVFSPDGHLLYAASDDRHVSVWDTLSGTLVNSFSHAGMALTVDASPDHRHFVVGCADHNVVLWDMGMQRSVQQYDQHADQVWNVAFDKADGATGGKFASVGDDGLLQTYS
jgi:WD repeat-containing protein 61